MRTREAVPRSPGPVQSAPVARPRRVHILIRDAPPSCSSEGRRLKDTAFEEAECWSQSEDEEEAGGGNPPAAVALDRNLVSGRHRHRQCAHSAHGHDKQQKHARTAMTADSALSTAWWREWSDFINQAPAAGVPVHHNLDRNVIKAELEDEYDDMPPLIGGGFAEVVNVKMNEVKVTQVAPQSAAEFDFFERQFEVD